MQAENSIPTLAEQVATRTAEVQQYDDVIAMLQDVIAEIDAGTEQERTELAAYRGQQAALLQSNKTQRLAAEMIRRALVRRQAAEQA